MTNCKLGQTEFSAVTEVQVRQRQGRRRSPTLLKLQWLAERMRKCERIKKQVAEGGYKIDNLEVAKALLNMRVHDEQE